jgi:hypothetical protein
VTRTSNAPIALGSVAFAAALAAWGTFGEAEDHWGSYFAVLAIIAAGALVVFAGVVPRVEQTGAVGVALSTAALLAIAVFWSGLPIVLAAGGAALGWTARDRFVGRAAIALAALAVLADLVVYVADMT